MGVNLFQYKTLSNLGILCLIHVLNMFVLPTKLRKVESKTKNLVLFFFRDGETSTKSKLRKNEQKRKRNPIIFFMREKHQNNVKIA